MSINDAVSDTRAYTTINLRDFDVNLARLIKSAAAEQGVSMKEWFTRVAQDALASGSVANGRPTDSKPADAGSNPVTPATTALDEVLAATPKRQGKTPAAAPVKHQKGVAARDTYTAPALRESAGATPFRSFPKDAHKGKIVKAKK